jgi:hypothetical protein
MKTILLLSGVLLLLGTSGCIVAGDDRHRHDRDHGAVIVGPPAVIVE